MQRLIQMAGCDDGTTCDGVFLDPEAGTVLVRGQAVGAATLERADGELVVTIPAAMLVEAARKL